MGTVGVFPWGKFKAQYHLDFIVSACLKGKYGTPNSIEIKVQVLESYLPISHALKILTSPIELVGSPEMLPPTDTVDLILPGENAATGELEAGEPNIPKYPMDMASMTPRKNGPLCMIIRLGRNPRCEFVNGVPPLKVKAAMSKDE